LGLNTGSNLIGFRHESMDLPDERGGPAGVWLGRKPEGTGGVEEERSPQAFPERVTVGGGHFQSAPPFSPPSGLRQGNDRQAGTARRQFQEPPAKSKLPAGMTPIRNSRLAAGLLIVLPHLVITSGSAFEESEVRPLLESYCFKCHSDKKTKAGINFEEFSDSLDVWRSRKTWTRVRDALDGGDMPPEDAKELPDATRAALSEWVGRTLDNVDASRLPLDPGHVPPRRLNRTEYRYTVADLFGIESSAYAILPEDQVSEGGFDNEAATLATQPLLIEKFLQAADAVVAEIWNDKVALERLIFEAPPLAPATATGSLPMIGDRQQGAALDMGDGSFMIGVRFKTNKGGALFSKAPEADEWLPGAKVLYVTDRGELAYDIGWLGQKHSGRKVNDGRWHTAVLLQKEAKTSAWVDGELVFEADGMTLPDIAGHRFKIGAAGDEFANFKGEIRHVHFYGSGMDEDVALRLSKGGESPGKPDFVWDASAEPAARPLEIFNEPESARRVLARFLSQAFRREATDEELTRYCALFQGARTLGDDYHTAMKLPVRTALVSPSFLFRSERVQTGGAAYKISSAELANRLSYFLWSSMPDARLLKLGAEGKLADAGVFNGEVTRMLQDPRALRMSRHFGSQWLRIDGLGQAIRPDKEIFPHADAELLEAMKEESVLFLHSVFRDDLPLRTLLDSDYTYANQRLAEHYGMLGIAGDEMRRIQLTGSGLGRGGVLTQASVLTVTSSPRRSSPVFRGKWILAVVLGQPPPPPPPNIPALEASAEMNPASLREALTAHRADSACASCHNKIDPLGFALEAFDATGKLREGPVDNAGTLPDGSTFVGHDGLKELLQNNREDEFIRHFSSQLLAYALGRELTFADERALQTILKRVGDAGFSSQTLVREIVSSYPFQYCKQPEPQGESPSR
jgi:hypothetical protein